MTHRQRVVVVTGGGGGIGAAIAEELGRAGTFVVTMDPLVTIDGAEQLPAPEETTAGRIVAAGGAARASSVSVTDAVAVRELFDGLVQELGGLDAVINVAGISRPTSFTRGSEADWLSVLSVHLDGYLNVLGAALPIMAAAGRGRILGVTSGSGWRAADTGAYGCAKRAVASLTWQLGRHTPAGVVVNAMSPIAATRMVTQALGLARQKPPPSDRAPRKSGAPRLSATGGLSLASMPTPEQLGPIGAHLVDEAFSWCSGKVIFAGGSEVAVIDEPRVLEVVRADPATSLAGVLEAVTAGALIPAEAKQGSAGGTNSRFGFVFDVTDAADESGETGDAEVVPSAVRSCAIVADVPAVVSVIAAALDARGIASVTVSADDLDPGFEAAGAALDAAAERVGPIDAVVVALAGAPWTAGSTTEWQQLLDEHVGIVGRIHADASWARAVADHSARSERPVRLVTLTDATTAGGRSRAQAATQLSRSARRATDDRVAAFSVSVESPWAGGPHGELVAHLLASPDTPALSGAELVIGDGWFGLRSHPHPIGSVSFGGPAVPVWLDETLRLIVGEETT